MLVLICVRTNRSRGSAVSSFITSSPRDIRYSFRPLSLCFLVTSWKPSADNLSIWEPKTQILSKALFTQDAVFSVPLADRGTSCKGTEADTRKYFFSISFPLACSWNNVQYVPFYLSIYLSGSFGPVCVGYCFVTFFWFALVSNLWDIFHSFFVRLRERRSSVLCCF